MSSWRKPQIQRSVQDAWTCIAIFETCHVTLLFLVCLQHSWWQPVRWRILLKLQCLPRSTSRVCILSVLCSGLDNLPAEVSHILREIEIKDGKVQGKCQLLTEDTLSRISSKESQMKEAYSSMMNNSGTPSNSDNSQTKLDKLSTRIAADYSRAEELSSEKSALALMLWRKVYAYHQRLLHDLNSINEDLVASVSSSVPKPPVLAEPSQLPLLLLNAGIGDSESDVSEVRVRRKRASHITEAPARASSYISGRGTGRASSNGDVSDGRSNGKDETIAADGEEERDENLYCFCQRGSFGEMIGCDSDDCKYEWFHIGCVGVSKPLPQTWVCSDCQAKNKKRRRG